MEAILVLMKLLFASVFIVMFMAGVDAVLREVAKQITKNMKDDERYDG